MKINKLTIENFKAIEHYEYLPKNKLAVLCAENGKGKTSFLEAVRFGLSGDAPSDCINDSAMSASVAIEADDGIAFTRIKHREKPTKVLLNGKTTTAKNLDIITTDATGVSRDVAKTITSQEIVAAMKPDDLGTFLMGYIPEELDFDTVVSYIPLITAEHISILSDYLPPMPITFGVDTIEKAYEQIFSARSFAKKDKYHRDAQIDAAVTDPPARTLSDIEENEKRVFAEEGAQKATAAAKALYEAAVRNKERIELELAQIKRDIDSNSATKPVKDKLEVILSQKEDVIKEMNQIHSLTATLKNNVSVFQNTLENLNKPVCPISEKLVCTTDKRPVKEELQELLASNKEGLEIQYDLLSQASARLDDLNAKEKAYRENSFQYDAKLALIRRFEALKKSVPEIPPCPAAVTTEVDYTAVKKALTEEKRYCERYMRNEQLKSESAIFEKRYEQLDFLCSALEPKGEVMTGITAFYLSDFETVINSRADDLGTGYKVCFENNEGVHYTIKTPHVTTYRPYDNLSNGEKIIAIFLLLDMLNTLCGLRMLLLDDVNHLDSNNFNSVFELLLNPSLQEDYDHIFICAAVNSDIEAAIKAHTDVDIIF